MQEQPRPVEIHLFAAAQAAAQEKVLLVAAGTLSQVLDAAVAQRPGLEAVLRRCSALVDGTVIHDDDFVVAPGARVDVLPPFAGG